MAEAAQRRTLTSNAVRPPHPQWKLAAPEPATTNATYSHHEKMPSLPILPLAPTLEKLKESLKPLAWNEGEYAATVRKIDDFAKSGALGPVLQQRLQEYAKDKRHWLESWWDDLGYLTYRDSVVVNVSYYYGFDEHPSHLPQTPAHRAASIARAALLFRRQLKQGLLPADATKEGPICMDSYRWMFDCCRIPGLEGADWSHTYAKPGEDGNAGHIIVFRRNSMWKVDIAPNGQLLSVAQLEQVFKQIIQQADGGAYPAIGFLAANNRDEWAKDYAQLISNPTNEAHVRDIHSSAFIVCLDESKPEGPVEYSRALWHGGASGAGLATRWVDKPVQFVVYDNMKAGIMGEHSVMDGTPTVRLCDDVLNMIASPSFDTGDAAATSAPAPEQKSWVVDSALEKRITAAKAAAAELCDTQSLGFHLTRYGKAQVKKFGFSPDGWAQMIVQLAYSRLLRKHPRLQADGNAVASEGERVKLPGGTYEAATTRKFFKGRTEAIRVTSEDSRAWVAAMEDAKATPETRRGLFANALKRHGADARTAGNGQGIDRHIFGLKLSRKPEDAPVPLFDDALFQRGSTWVLSTSAIFSNHFPVYGWGEVVPNGFGVAYMTGFEDHLQYTITSRVEMPNQDFVDEIARAAEELRELFASAPAPETPKAKL